MELYRIVWRDYRWAFIGVVLLSLTSAGLGIGVIAFINQRLHAQCRCLSSPYRAR